MEIRAVAFLSWQDAQSSGLIQLIPLSSKNKQKWIYTNKNESTQHIIIHSFQYTILATCLREKKNNEAPKMA